MFEFCQQVIEQLSININLFVQRLEATSTSNKKQLKLSELEKIIICQSLLGYSRQQIAHEVNLPEQNIRDKLSRRIYPAIAEVLEADQKEIAGNWVMILNLLLNPKNGYKLNSPPQLNSDNFQGSFGRQFFLYSTNKTIVQLQVEGSQFYQQGLFYQALKCFLWAWKQEINIYSKGNPEVLIYINNCLIEYKKNILKEQNVNIYTIAVVVPFHHNQGGIATEILRGVSQIQLQVNIQSFDKINIEKEISLDDIRPNTFFNINNAIIAPIALQVLIVNDLNNLYTQYNQTAENLVNLASQLNLMAIIGHYSSEMTKKALELYAKNGLLLINPSSTSNELSYLSGGERLSFFRLTTQDSVNARRLADYLIEKSAIENTIQGKSQNKVAIVYNKNSSYSTSYRNTISEYLKQHKEKFVFLDECGDISENYYQIQTYLKDLKKKEVDIIIIIPDGGIEPLSLSNSWLISRLNLKNCLIAGSATFYQENVLHWIQEQSQFNSSDRDETSKNQCQIIACIPWHWQSQKNGCNSDNYLAQNFCQIGTKLWGKENLTWRSATAFDSVLIILRILEKYRSQNSQSLLVQMNKYFKEQKNTIEGVTGTIEFNETGDRVNPSTEIAAVKWNEQQQKCMWEV
ncbi:MAG: ABC transporter substrate-binding protein [Mastigocoleus sp. MO_167.B18]|nr:ABC transporter substrate-binding protein [Mastigocoleus sp. MO_167.B18]